MLNLNLIYANGTSVYRHLVNVITAPIQARPAHMGGAPRSMPSYDHLFGFPLLGNATDFFMICKASECENKLVVSRNGRYLQRHQGPKDVATAIPCTKEASLADMRKAWCLVVLGGSHQQVECHGVQAMFYSPGLVVIC